MGYFDSPPKEMPTMTQDKGRIILNGFSYDSSGDTIQISNCDSRESGTLMEFQEATPVNNTFHVNKPSKEADLQAASLEAARASIRTSAVVLRTEGEALMEAGQDLRVFITEPGKWLIDAPVDEGTQLLIAAAVLAERESCAKVADEAARTTWCQECAESIPNEIAAAIRARRGDNE